MNELPDNSLEYMNHSHYADPHSLLIFSNDDIDACYQYITANKTTDPSTFSFSVVTSQGTSYTMVMEDRQKFDNFYSSYLGANRNTFYIYIDIDTNTSTENEQNFLKMINTLGMGVSLLKSNTDFTDWNKLNFDPTTNSFTTNNCN